MKFGKIENIDHVDFTFPPSHPGTEKILGGVKNKTFHVHIGAAVWNDPGFPGKIYPPRTKDKDFLKFYGKQFNCIELNATHYRIPDPNTVKRWREMVPEGFKFCPKIHQSISHSSDINHRIGEVNAFYESILHFKNKLGSCFLQLPPTFESKHLELLIEFLDNSPIHDLAVELRHQSWFTDTKALNYLCNYLFKHDLSLNITDVAGRRDVLHQRLTNKTAFVRFVANDLHPSDFLRLDDWVQRLTTWIVHGLEQIYFLIHTSDKSLTPELAIYFINRLNKANHLALQPPKIIENIGEDTLL
jgi:uncharacterized protein YecE (DUF72 family)